MINKKLNFKIFCLMVSALIAGALIPEVTNSIKNSIPILKLWWVIILIIFPIIDYLVWLKTGEEIILWILSQFGIEFD